MKANANITRLRRLQAEVDRIRLQLGFHPTGAVLYRESLDGGDELIVVEADGFGGATISVVEGDFPVDFLTRYTKQFDTEEAAIRAAEAVAKQNAPAGIVLAP